MIGESNVYYFTGFYNILVIMDRLSKQSIFILTHDTITSAELAKLFVIHVFSKHRVPSHVTSNQGSEFMSSFQTFGKALNMKLHFTSSYHPEGDGQSDGQTECTNQTLKQYFRIYCNYQHSNWSNLLPLAEFAYNNTLNVTTGVSSIFANKGYNPNLSVHPEQDLVSTHTHDFVVDLNERHQQLRLTISNTQK